MMDIPFFRNRWHSPAAPRYSRGIPAKGQATPSPKVVSIPVRFVESERARTASALKIQKVFRGFLVRKSMKKILAIRSEVDEIELRISRKETVDLIRNDPKERLKVNEALMALLFKLDSVRGVDSGVRDCRKAVIRKVIVLQETADGIAHQTLGVADGTDTEIQALETGNRGNCADNSDAVDSADVIDGIVESQVVDGIVESKGNGQDLADQTLGLQDDDVESIPHLGEAQVILSGAIDKSLEKQVSNASVHKPSASEGVEPSQMETQSESSTIYPNLIGEGEENTWTKQEDAMEISLPEKPEEISEVNFRTGGRDDKKRKEEGLLERMMQDNEKLMSLMTDLLVRNEIQTRLLSSLSERVEQLERAFMSDKKRRKKKRCVGGRVDGMVCGK